VSAKRLFQDFTHSEGHKNLTGAEAEIKPEVGTELKLGTDTFKVVIWP